MPPTKVGLSDVMGWDVLQEVAALACRPGFGSLRCFLSRKSHTRTLSQPSFTKIMDFPGTQARQGRVAHIPNNTHTTAFVLGSDFKTFVPFAVSMWSIGATAQG